ncbi:MAG: M16 family metallopeptidase [Gemmatimonadales bacterium]
MNAREGGITKAELRRSIQLTLQVLLVLAPMLSARGWGQDLSSRINSDSLEIHIPDAHRYMFQLDNGIIGFMVADINATVVELSAYVAGGFGDDRVQGSAEIMEQLFREGPCWMVPGSFERSMKRIGGSLSVSMGPEETKVVLTASPQHVRRALRIFSGILREPCIRQDALDSTRSLLAARVAPGVTSGDAVAFVPDASMTTAIYLFERRVFAHHSYARLEDDEEFTRLRVKDVQDFYQRIFVPRNTILTVSGLFDPAELNTDLFQRFGDWQARKRHLLRTATDIMRPESTQIIRYRSDVGQTHIVLGQDLPRVSPINWPVLEVLTYVLNDSPVSRDSSTVTAVLKPQTRGPGTFAVQISSAPGSGEALVHQVLERIRWFQNEDVDQKQLSIAKESLIIDVLNSRFRDSHAIARTFAEEYASRGDMGYMEAFPHLVARVTEADVRRVAKRILDPARMTAVIIEGTNKPGARQGAFAGYFSSRRFASDSSISTDGQTGVSASSR